MTTAIQHLPETERPRERLARQGTEALSSAELLAIVLGSGQPGRSVLVVAQELLARFETVEGLAAASLSELQEIPGIGKAKAVQLQAAMALARRMENRSGVRDKIIRPDQAYAVVRARLEKAPTEMLLAILLDTKGRVIQVETVGIGTLSETLVHPREVFYPAIRHKAATIILAHNHPSGDPTPSPEDIRVTRELKSAASLLQIELQDHLIVGSDGFVSLRERGVL